MLTFNRSAMGVAKVATTCLHSSMRKQMFSNHVNKRTQWAKTIAGTVNSIQDRIGKCMHFLCSFRICMDNGKCVTSFKMSISGKGLYALPPFADSRKIISSPGIDDSLPYFALIAGNASSLNLPLSIDETIGRRCGDFIIGEEAIRVTRCN